VKRLVVPAILVALAAGCGGGSSAHPAQSHTVLEVSKAFYDAGLPFTTLVTGNPYVTGQVPFLPFKLNGSDLRFHVAAELSGASTSAHSGEVVWVFDTDANAAAALKQVPLARWGQGPAHITREHLGNVIVVASGFAGTQKKKLDKALGALR
jgi:hypothetical protein